MRRGWRTSDACGDRMAGKVLYPRGITPSGFLLTGNGGREHAQNVVAAYSWSIRSHPGRRTGKSYGLFRSPSRLDRSRCPGLREGHEAGVLTDLTRGERRAFSAAARATRSPAFNPL